MSKPWSTRRADRGRGQQPPALQHPWWAAWAESDPPVTMHLISQLQPGDVLLACSDGVWHYFAGRTGLGAGVADTARGQSS